MLERSAVRPNSSIVLSPLVVNRSIPRVSPGRIVPAPLDGARRTESVPLPFTAETLASLSAVPV